MWGNEEDYVLSDEVEEVIDGLRIASASASNHSDGVASKAGNSTFRERLELERRSKALQAEISSVDQDIAKLQSLKKDLVEELSGLRTRVNARKPRPSPFVGVHGVQQGVDYFGKFDWSGELKKQAMRVFNIPSFRLCQEGVCNANIDGRDIVCVMPTGGGKSLTYQLPALLMPGCTLVISPLISLITDQILHLRDAGVEAHMLTGATSKEESRAILNRLTQTTTGKGKSKAVDQSQREIKLIYVTPEKLVKSKTFTAALQKLSNAGVLARIVLDEAHCVSQLGHDFRPDYKKLSILRQLFPHVPILALSATCPPKVLQDILTILRMKAVVDGKAAPTEGTVYFSAPLYRANLHYAVIQKPASAPALIQTMTDYILEAHANHSGIIYCLSKKDAETVAVGVQEASNGKIRTGVYHADVGDGEKERLHKRWRKGEVQVVCATIAFGLGIDKGDVRFVLHHSMSKSLDGFYQESGRAGRDGKDSDCILYYRGQDATRLSGLICGELEGQSKLYEMLKFAGNLEECRKVQFAKYFSTSSSLSINAWSTDGKDSLTRCGHCDNCIRPPEAIERRDVTVQAWQLVKIVEAIAAEGGRVTLGMLADLARGAGGGAFGVGSRSGKGKSKEKVGLDLEVICGGKVDMSRDDVESLLIHLLLSRHFKEDFQTTAYSVNVYIIPGSQALRLSRLSRADVEGGKCPKIEHSFLNKTGKRKSLTKPKPGGKGGKRTTLDPVQGDDDDGSETQQTPFQRVGTTKIQPQHGSKAATRTTKRKRIMSSDDEKGGVPDQGDDIAHFIVDDKVDDFRVGGDLAADEYTSSSAQDEWSHSLTINHSRGSKPPNKRRRLIQPNVIELSD